MSTLKACECVNASGYLTLTFVGVTKWQDYNAAYSVEHEPVMALHAKTRRQATSQGDP